MATGAQMLLKSLGIDPEKITEVASGIQKAVQDFNARLERVENLCTSLHAQNEKIITSLRVDFGYDELKGALTDGRENGDRNCHDGNSV